MHDIEPYYNWRHLYIAAEDERSPFFGTVYSEFEFTHSIYNFLIHPQWDSMESPTLFLKILFTDYEEGYAMIEFIGEWNDCINNDIMILKRDILDKMMGYGINKFLLIGENVLNFHASDDCYYEEWFDEVSEENGWIAFINFREHVLEEFKNQNIDYYVNWGGELNELPWRNYTPAQLNEKVQNILSKRLS